MWLKNWALAAVAVLAPVHSVISTAICLIVIDFLTGCIAAYKCGDKLTSAKISRSFAKGFVYTVGISVGFLVETYMLKGLLPVSTIAASAIGLTECLSIYENLNKISGTNVLRSVIDKLSSQNLPK